ncbi:MAG: DUF3078 domain-containing protein [Rhodothermales bacterium]
MSTSLLMFALVVMAGAFQTATAQEAEVDTTGWRNSVIASLAGSQASYRNWSEGGLNSVAFTSGLLGEQLKHTEHWLRKRKLRLAFGLLKQDTLDVRKADDIIHLESSAQYQGERVWSVLNPILAFSFRSQMAEGFDYGTTPSPRVSAFLAPATSTQTIGLAYQPVDWFSQRFGFAAKETIVTIEELRESYGNAADETLRLEGGFDFLSQLDKQLVENVVLKSSLGVFLGFSALDKPDVRWENLVSMKVNSWLSVNFEFVTFYDLDISDKAQFKQVLSTGVSFSLL